MKKLLMLAVFACLCTGAFAQQLFTSLKDGSVLQSKTQASFSPKQTYFFFPSTSNLEIYRTGGSFKVADFYEQQFMNGGEPQSAYTGEIEFSFTPVMTQKGLALKITSKVTDWDGLKLKGALLEASEDAQGVKVKFTVQGTWTEKAVRSAEFDVLVTAADEAAVIPLVKDAQQASSVQRELAHSLQEYAK